MKISLGQIFAAVRAGDAALVGEVVGYLVLGAADRALQELGECNWETVFVNDAGEVVVQGQPSGQFEIERNLRSILGWLLDEVRSPFPNLRRVAERHEPRGLKSLVTELEAALVPVNRRAAARSLSRLAREAQKSSARFESGGEKNLVRQPQAERPHSGLIRAGEPRATAPRPDPRFGQDEFVDAVRVQVHEPVVEREPLERQAYRGAEADLHSPPPSAPDSSDDEPTLVRASTYSEPPPPASSSMLPPQFADEVEVEFDVEFEDFELSAVVPPPSPRLTTRSPEGLSADRSSETPSEERSTAPPRSTQNPPGSSRYRSVRPGADTPPSAPLIVDRGPVDARPSDISALLAALRRDDLPREELFQALTALSEEPGGSVRSGNARR